MGTGYTRNDVSNNISDGSVIDASDLDGEFDALVTAFSTSGHTHDGTAAEGGPVTVLGPAQEYVGDGTSFSPKADDTYDLGTASLQWKDLYLDGLANLDDLTVTGTATFTGATLVGLTFNMSTSTLTGTTAQFNTALSDDNFVTIGAAETLTGAKTFTARPIISNTTPALDFKETDGTTTHNVSRWINASDIFSLYTLDNSNVFVATEYKVTKGASGATEQEWYISGSAALTLDSTGLAVVSDVSSRGNTVAKVLLDSQTASASSVIAFTDIDVTNYKTFEVEFENVLPATDGAGLRMRVSSDTGGTPVYDTGASDYTTTYSANREGTVSDTATTGNTAIISSSIGTGAGETGLSGTLKLLGASVSNRLIGKLDVGYTNSSAQVEDFRGTVKVDIDQVTNAVNFFMSTGNIASGTIRLYGIKG